MVLRSHISVKEKTKIIDTIINPIMSEIGFPKIEPADIDKGYYWVASKREGDLIKWISIDDIYGKLELILRTNVYKTSTLFAGKNVKEPFSCNKGEWYYTTKEEFVEIISCFKERILKSALEALETISISPIKEIPTRKANLYIYHEHAQIYQKCIQKWGLEGKDIETIVSFMEHFIVENKEKEFEEMEAILVEMAATLGDAVIKTYGGTWIWVDTYGNAVVDKIGVRETVRCPLADIMWNWRHRNDRLNLSCNYSELMSLS